MEISPLYKCFTCAVHRDHVVAGTGPDGLLYWSEKASARSHTRVKWLATTRFDAQQAAELRDLQRYKCCCHGPVNMTYAAYFPPARHGPMAELLTWQASISRSISACAFLPNYLFRIRLLLAAVWLITGRLDAVRRSRLFALYRAFFRGKW